MTLKDDLTTAVDTIFKSRWTERDGTVVPDDTSLKLGNDAVKLKATVLYADMADSTKLVDGYKAFFAAEMYKTYLHCAGKIIRDNGGIITAYDGDRIMAVYIGDMKNSSAVKTAMKLRWAVSNIIHPAQAKQYPKNAYALKHTIGIDTSDLFVAKTGVRGANDLVWVGRAANHAAKMAALVDGYTYISESTYKSIEDACKYGTRNGAKVNMWTSLNWDDFDGRTMYRSHWNWSL